MSAFDKSSGAGGPDGVDLNDIISQMFGMNMGGGGGDVPPGFGGAGAGARKRPRKGANEEQTYEVTLEELYKGKNTRFSSTKMVICGHCHGSGGKEKAKPKTCDACKGSGMQQKLQPVGPGLVSPVTVSCGVCNGAGRFFKDKDRCKKCKGQRTQQTKKMLELYIPPGSRQGEHIVLTGEADQHPDQTEPGDIIFELREIPHDIFTRAGADLAADMEITLAEALTGLDRVVLEHLDERGIHVKTPKGQVLRPDQVLKVSGEGMPQKRSDSKGDLYLEVKIDFPKDGWLKDSAGDMDRLRDLLPKGNISPIKADEVDEVEYDATASIDDFGQGSGDPRAGGDWEDDEDDDGKTQCAQQ